MNIKSSITHLFIWSIPILLASNEALSAEVQPQDSTKQFAQENTVSLSPVFGVMKNKHDHVATVHGFPDNLEICTEFAQLLNQQEAHTSTSYSCVQLRDGAMK